MIPLLQQWSGIGDWHSFLIRSPSLLMNESPLLQTKQTNYLTQSKMQLCNVPPYRKMYSKKLQWQSMLSLVNGNFCLDPKPATYLPAGFTIDVQLEISVCTSIIALT